MLNRILTVATLLCALLSANAFAVYFPSGIDWTNESRERFVMSLYLNVLGRAPDTGELRTLSQRLARNDSSQGRLDLFRQFLDSTEYGQLFPDNKERWQVFRAADMNYNRGNGFWRYEASRRAPAGFQSWELSGKSTEPVARAMATFYDAFCYAGIPCVEKPEDAARRADPVLANQSASPAHACADESQQQARFEWIAFNGSTYPRGTDANTLCMGDHYYRASGTLLQRFQCETGYRNCRRDQRRDIRGERTGQDDNGNPTLFFSDGSRLVLTNYDQLYQSSQSGDQQPQITTAVGEHECADPAQITRYYQWRGANGTSQSNGVGNNIVCMEDYYYAIEGMTLRHHACDRGFSNCRAAPSKDVVAQRRTRVDGKTALQFNNGTTLSVLDRAAVANSSGNLSGAGSNTTSTVTEAPSRRLAGQHECGVSTMRLSQFRWVKRDGTTSWPDGVGGTVVCMDNAYYQIEGSVLRHHQCAGDFQNCRRSRGKDLISLEQSTNANGLSTLKFANGDQLSLISR